MKLFLASEAKEPRSMKKLEQFVGGFKGKKIGYIPTAANGEEPYGTWKTGTTWNIFNATGASIELLELEDYKKMHFPEMLCDKDILFVAGGMCGYLMYWMRRTRLDRCIPDLLSKGLIYVGSSAGSMVTAPTLHTAEIYLNDPEVGAEVIPGLGLVDFDFYPHFSDEMLDPLKKVYKGNKMYLVKNGDAVTVEGVKVEVLGEEIVIES